MLNMWNVDEYENHKQLLNKFLTERVLSFSCHVTNAYNAMYICIILLVLLFFFCVTSQHVPKTCISYPISFLFYRVSLSVMAGQNFCLISILRLNICSERCYLILVRWVMTYTMRMWHLYIHSVRYSCCLFNDIQYAIGNKLEIIY